MGGGRRGEARKDRLESGLYPYHLRHAVDHGGAAGLLQKVRTQRGSAEGLGVGHDPRSRTEQTNRCYAHADAHAPGDFNGNRLSNRPVRHAGGGERERPGDHLAHQTQRGAERQRDEGIQIRGALRLFDAQFSFAVRPGRGRAGSR